MKAATHEQKRQEEWRLRIWWILGLALFLRSLLPILGYCYTRDVTIFYTPDTESYLIPPASWSRITVSFRTARFRPPYGTRRSRRRRTR
jgi:hypothetical protein